MLKFMRTMVVDSCTILLGDVSRRVGLNGGAESLVVPRWNLYTFVVDLALRGSVL